MAGDDIVIGKYIIIGADPRALNTIRPAGGLGKHRLFEIDHT